MKPNPQDLINMRGAGNAEKALRKAGMWKPIPGDKPALPPDDVMKGIRRVVDNLISHIDDLSRAASDLVDAANSCEYALDDLIKAMEANQ